MFELLNLTSDVTHTLAASLDQHMRAPLNNSSVSMLVIIYLTRSLSGSKADYKDEEVVVMLWDHDEEQSARAAVKELSKIKSVGGLGRYGLLFQDL